jgi:hypothetical protein
MGVMGIIKSANFIDEAIGFARGDSTFATEQLALQTAVLLPPSLPLRLPTASPTGALLRQQDQRAGQSLNLVRLRQQVHPRKQEPRPASQHLQEARSLLGGSREEKRLFLHTRTEEGKPRADTRPRQVLVPRRPERFQASQLQLEEETRRPPQSQPECNPRPTQPLGPGHYSTISDFNGKGSYFVAKYPGSGCAKIGNSRRFDKIQTISPGPGNCTSPSIQTKTRR